MYFHSQLVILNIKHSERSQNKLLKLPADKKSSIFYDCYCECLGFPMLGEKDSLQRVSVEVASPFLNYFANII